MMNSIALVPGYEGRYVITSNGEVWSTLRIVTKKNQQTQIIHSRRIAQTIDIRSGYPQVKLTKPDGSWGNQYVHRLLAKAFIYNPDNKETVNHKNGNKLDYRLENLEWMTYSENQKHAIQMGLAKLPAPKRKPVINRCTGETYPSIAEASRSTGLSPDKLHTMIYFKESCFDLAA